MIETHQFYFYRRSWYYDAALLSLSFIATPIPLFGIGATIIFFALLLSRVRSMLNRFAAASSRFPFLLKLTYVRLNLSAVPTLERYWPDCEKSACRETFTWKMCTVGTHTCRLKFEINVDGTAVHVSSLGSSGNRNSPVPGTAPKISWSRGSTN